MRKLFVFIYIVICTSSYAQNIFFNDKIITVYDDTLEAMIENVAIHTLTYRYKGEHTAYTISKNTVKELVYNDGRVEKVSTPVIINSEKDWEKIKITANPQDVEGLKEKGIVSLIFNSFLDLGINMDKMDREIRKTAASQKAHIVLIQIMTGYPSNQFYFKGVSYGY